MRMGTLWKSSGDGGATTRALIQEDSSDLNPNPVQSY